MSFILDALRKSDSEHQQQRSPEYVAPPRAARRRTVPRWLWVFALLLAVNAVLIVAMMLRGGGGPAAVDAAAVPAVTAGAGAAVPVTTADDPPPKAPVRSLLEETIRDAREARAAAPETAPRPAPVRTETAATAATVQPALAAGDAGASGSAALDLRTLDELRARGDISIADLHVDLHVYSSNRSGRFLFVNGRRYNEGDRLAEGPSVLEITDFGAVLEYDQRRFLLPRE